jgi:pilus assembly protein CpaB
VASETLAAGTVLKPADLRWQGWPEAALDPSFLVREKGADPQKDAVGHIVLHGIEKGEPVTADRLLKPGDSGFLAAALAPGMRAVTIKIDAVSAAGGFILPGDRVDVLLSEHYTVPAEASPATERLPQVPAKDVASVVLSNVKVLAIDQVMQDIDSKPKVGATATLEVDIVPAEKLALAAQMGTLSLALRSHTLPERPEPMTNGSVVQDFQVSPFRAALMQQYDAALPGVDAAGGLATTLHVYHGVALARAVGP